MTEAQIPVKLTCRAKGVPLPRVNWKREDAKNIIIREPVVASNGQKSKVSSVSEYHGEELRLTKISRHDMGAYLCIASNGVPPAISKRITINDFCKKLVAAKKSKPNLTAKEVDGSFADTKVYVNHRQPVQLYHLRDRVLQAFPQVQRRHVWIADDMIISGVRHEVQVIPKSAFQVKMVLTIRNLQKQDFGSYTCAAKNSRGDVDFSIRLYEISGPSRPGNSAPTYYDEEENIEEIVYGSADLEKMENKAYAVDNTVQGHMGNFFGASSPSPPTKVIRRRPISGTGSSPGNRVSASPHPYFHKLTHVWLMLLIIYFDSLEQSVILNRYGSSNGCSILYTNGKEVDERKNKEEEENGEEGSFINKHNCPNIWRGPRFSKSSIEREPEPEREAKPEPEVVERDCSMIRGV
ncbi:Similar to LAC: Lachesin (Schistocerca americana) [Cotesia congregata]|uniref:Similar to LAC: Lachesin (Schistocerca americana) n=1 Tax=Cotesia congregata TaxID=51543 RepID=A0A8J2MWL5_COTCN|nr:Similar to LAC: Lachesin (Schistocerca americana) [Cotesia congregata]